MLKFTVQIKIFNILQSRIKYYMSHINVNRIISLDKQSEYTGENDNFL